VIDYGKSQVIEVKNLNLHFQKFKQFKHLNKNASYRKRIVEFCTERCIPVFWFNNVNEFSLIVFTRYLRVTDGQTDGIAVSISRVNVCWRAIRGVVIKLYKRNQPVQLLRLTSSETVSMERHPRLLESGLAFSKLL